MRALVSAHAPRAPTSTAKPATAAAVRVRLEPYRLPAPVQRAVAVAVPAGILIAGGLDAGGASTTGVFRLDPASGRLTRLGAVPQPFHDAAGGTIGDRLFVFGGGSSASSATVQSFDLASRRGAVVAQLPHPLSDLASATIGRHDLSRRRLRRSHALAPRSTRRPTERTSGWRAACPQGVRYPAVAAIGGRLVIAGGILSSGAPSAAVYVFDPRSGHVQSLGRLATAVGHASAVTIGGAVYIVGGLDAAGRSRLDCLTHRRVPSDRHLRQPAGTGGRRRRRRRWAARRI